MREIAVLKKMDHPNVVRLYEVIDPPGASYMMMVSSKHHSLSLEHVT